MFVLAALLLGLFTLTGVAGAAQSPDPVPSLEDCQPDAAHYGQLPSCTYDGNGKLINKSYDNDPFGDGGGGGMPGEFVGFIVIAIFIGVGVTVWRVSMARDMARRAGLDPNDATAVTLMSDDGLGATYLAASLAGNRQPAPPSSGQPATDPGHVVADLSGASAPADAEATPARSSADRLKELQQLKEQGLVTDAEYDARRKAILESI